MPLLLAILSSSPGWAGPISTSGTLLVESEGIEGRYLYNVRKGPQETHVLVQRLDARGACGRRLEVVLRPDDAEVLDDRLPFRRCTGAPELPAPAAQAAPAALPMLFVDPATLGEGNTCLDLPWADPRTPTCFVVEDGVISLDRDELVVEAGGWATDAGALPSWVDARLRDGSVVSLTFLPEGQR